MLSKKADCKINPQIKGIYFTMVSSFSPRLKKDSLFRKRPTCKKMHSTWNLLSSYNSLYFVVNTKIEEKIYEST